MTRRNLTIEIAKLRQDRDAILRQLCGWLSADIPELHAVEMSRLADSLDRFLAALDAPKTP